MKSHWGPEWMCQLVRAPPLEGDAVDVNGCAGVVRGNPRGSRRSGEGLRVGRAQRRVGRAENLHFFLGGAVLFAGTSGRGSGTNPSRFGIFTFGSVVSFSTSCSVTMPFRKSR